MRVIRRGILVMLLGAAVGLSPPAVQAQQTFFGEDLNGTTSVRLGAFPNATDARNLFLANLVGVGTESFEGFAGGSSPPLNLSFPGAGTATLSGDASVVDLPTGTSVGRYPTDGNKYVSANFGSSTGGFRIDFGSAVAAFGFMGTDIGDFGAQLLLRFYHFAGGFSDVLVPHKKGTGGGSAPDGAVLFFGYINALNPFIAVEFLADVSGLVSTDVFGFDPMTIGSVEQVVTVPEPLTLLLLGPGLLGVAALRRRRGPGLAV
jgi:hypothetical protein